MKKILCTFLLAGLCLTGKGQTYFQQDVSYEIKVSLNDDKHLLSATEKLVYKNNSPQALNEIYMHLWPNAYRNNTTALAQQLLENGEKGLWFAGDEKRGFIDSLDFKVDGEKVNWSYDPVHPDIAILKLNTPLAPGSSLTITTPFLVKIPDGSFSRLGHIGQQYQVTQWYPKPAVYDRLGWHPIPYLDQGEFYSEYGTFDVFITLPENYVVGATGDLVDGEKEKRFLENRVEETKQKTSFSKKAGKDFPPSSVVFKTLHFHQEKVHDFAWFADKRYYVLKGEVELPSSKRKVTTWAMFTEEYGEFWKKSLPYLHDATYYYSLWNGDYPYNHVTAVDGALSAGGGMEYPNITVIGSVNSDFMLETVIMHEVGHNWFYGILGSNERVHGWMDEGINSFNEMRYIRTKYPDRKLLGDFSDKGGKGFDLSRFKQRSQYELLYLLQARDNRDQAIETHSADFTSANYGAIMYSKTALVFDYLRAYLGTQKFDTIMHRYFDLWKFKHPYPEDIKAVFEKESGKDLSWFFGDMIGTSKKLDYAIKKVKKDKASDEPVITITNKGDIAAPFCLTALQNGKVKATAWYDGFSGSKDLYFFSGEYDAFTIDHQNDAPEFNRKNDHYNRSWLFNKTEPLKLQWLGSLPNENFTQICYTPVAGWNSYNGLLAGIAFYNAPLPRPKFEYTIMPLYGVRSKDLAGSTQLAYNFYPDKNFRSIRIFGETKNYAENGYMDFAADRYNWMNYMKVSPGIEFNLMPSNPRSKLKQSISLRSVMVWGSWNNSENFLPLSGTPFPTYDINELKYLVDHKKSLHPYSFQVSYQHSQYYGFGKLFAQLNQKINYGSSSKGINLRVFGGTFLYDESSLPYFGFGMSGSTDYMYDNTLLSRSRNGNWLGNAQLVDDDGGFRNITTLPNTNQWLAALNVSVDLPGKLPVALYGDYGYAPDLGGKVTAAYDAGATLKIAGEFCAVHFPFVTSSNLNALKYSEKIRVTLNLHLLKPQRLSRSINL